MIKINLVPAEILAKADQKRQGILAGAAAAVLLTILAAALSGHYFHYKRLEAKLAKDQSDLKKLEIIVAKVEEIEKTAAAVRARLNVINDLLRSRPLYPYFMADFVRSVPEGVLVKTLSTSGGGSSAGPLKLNISGEAKTNEDIADWVHRMEESGRFSDEELGPVTTSEAAQVYTFTMKATYTGKL